MISPDLARRAAEIIEQEAAELDCLMQDTFHDWKKRLSALSKYHDEMLSVAAELRRGSGS